MCNVFNILSFNLMLFRDIHLTYRQWNAPICFLKFHYIPTYYQQVSHHSITLYRRVDIAMMFKQFTWEELVYIMRSNIYSAIRLIDPGNGKFNHLNQVQKVCFITWTRIFVCESQFNFIDQIAQAKYVILLVGATRLKSN